MEKTILFGSILSVFLLLTIPHISAIEFQTRKEVISNEIKEKINPFKQLIEFSNEESIKKQGLSVINYFDYIGDLLLSILLFIWEIQVYFYNLRIEWFVDGLFSNYPMLRNVLDFSIDASDINLNFYILLVLLIAGLFIQVTEQLPDVLEFFIIIFSIPFFVLLYLVNSFLGFIFSYTIVYISNAEWRPIFNFLFYVLVFLDMIFWAIIDLLIDSPVMNRLESKVNFCPNC